MKKLCNFIFVGVLVSLFHACEITLPLNELTQVETEGVVINALLNPDTTFSAYVTRAYLYTDKPTIPFYRSDDEGNVYSIYDEKINNHFAEEYFSKVKFNDTTAIMFIEDYVKENLKSSILTDAEVKVWVNEKEPFLMQYDTINCCYRSEYTPQEGDCVKVEITSSNGQKSVATTEIPRSQRLEIINMKLEERELHKKYEYERAYSGRLAKITLRLNDPANEKNYYRLKIRSIDRWVYTQKANTDDYFQSDDLIFRDERLVKEWAGWDAYFSNVFDDRLFDGETYTFDVESYIWGARGLENHPQYPFVSANFIIELQSLSEDYYHYLKSMMLYRITASDTYSEGIYVHSNNIGGWGILGALHGEEHIMLWDEEKKDWFPVKQWDEAENAW